MDDWENMESAEEIYLVEHGRNPKRELLTEKNFIWGEDDSFSLE